MKRFQDLGYEVAHDSDNVCGEVVIINTCGFIGDAKEESINTILEYVEAKKEGTIERLYVMGCLSERYLADLEEEIPEVVEVIEVSFRVERIEVFEDKNLENYTQEQLQTLIDEQVAIQQEAHKLAESARKLGWSEDSDAIYSAGSEWHNAQKVIDVYHAQKEKLIAIEKAEWEARKAKYPAATEIWLYMKELGWNDYVCAGIMGNLDQLTNALVNRFGHNATLLVEGILHAAAALGLFYSRAHGRCDAVGIHNDFALCVSRCTADGLNQ